MKFSIRDLLLLTVVVALALGWWVDHRMVGSREKALAKSQLEAEQKFQVLMAALKRREIMAHVDGNAASIRVGDKAEIFVFPFLRAP